MYEWQSRLSAEEAANAKKWAPAIASAESRYGLPAGLLARQALEESAYRSSIIDGTEASSAGALGILQLEPRYFQSVRGPRPFTDADTLAQIDEAAREDARLYRVYGAWPLALAAYNWGEGDLDQWLTAGGTLTDTSGWPRQTQNYVAQITADVPAAVSA